MSQHLLSFSQGFFMGAGLIIAIGAQNAFVLTQAIRARYHYMIALLCALIDASLITAGLVGMGALVNAHPLALSVFSWGGAAFLTWYGVRAFKDALHPGSLKARQEAGPGSPAAAISTTLAVSLLNPHVYLDTVVLLGGVGGALPADSRIVFGLGAITASFSWFFALAFGGVRLAPVFARPAAWRILDLFVAAVMFFIAGSLLWREVVN